MAGIDVSGTVDNIRGALEAEADASLAPGMEAYMKDRHAFLGVKSPVRRAAVKPLVAQLKDASQRELLAIAAELFDQEEREFAYVGADLLRKYSKSLGASALPALRQLVQTKSWWDTVDSLAPHPIGDVVRANPGLSEEMDQWIHDEDFWVARAAILHQLMWKEDTDGERLLHYCDVRGEDTEFFIRKALGWALRQYARIDPGVVRAYVNANADVLSGLTKREALKHIGP